jgi:hypothetical protein
MGGKVIVINGLGGDEIVVVCLRYYPIILLKRLRKITKIPKSREPISWHTF